MKTFVQILAATALFVLPSVAYAQADEHHPDAEGKAAAPAALPAQCEAMMPMMQQMMSMMGMMQGKMDGMSAGAAKLSEATQAYMKAMRTMDGPMMMGAQDTDPDVAFVKTMIPHHEGAIEMAKAALQYAKDDKVKAWANEIIAAQQAEIAEMQAWLKEHGQ